MTAAVLVFFSPLFGQGNIWKLIDENTLANRSQERWIVPEKYSSFSLDVPAFKAFIQQVPNRFNSRGESAAILLPMPDGSFEAFNIVEAPLMHPNLAARYREIKTFSGQGITNPASAVYLDWTPQGFHGMVLSPGKVIYIDPYFKDDNTLYLSYDRADYQASDSEGFSCATEEGEESYYLPSSEMLPIGQNNRATTNLLTYRIAIAATGEYTAYHGGTKPLALAAINTTLNRVRGIYETALSISFTLVSNNDLLIYTDGPTDPYTYPPGEVNLAENQTNVDNVIGNTNYDVGHLVSTGTGGVASISSVCSSSIKARGVTSTSNPKGDSFDVDFMTHELGHQFGSKHTFNGSTGSCAGSNRNASTAFEPGSGSTIMAYAGVCGAQNLQQNTHAYFHLSSLGEINYYTTVGTGSTCPVSTTTGNNIPVVNADPNGVNGKYIPISTPFELTASGTDADGDVLTYSWEEWDLGPQGAPSSSNATGPLFRSFPPTTSGTRTFPTLSNILDNTGSVGEFLPSVTRDLNFNCTARDNKSIGGGFDASGVVLHVSNVGGPFAITSHNSSTTINGNITLTWNVANTTASPISCANVDILLSLNGGLTFSSLLNNTPNDGSQVVTLPNSATGQARIKIKCADNVFFDINNADLRIAPADATCVEKIADGNMSNYASWTEYSTNGFFLIGDYGIYRSATGSAWLGSENNETSSVSQTITLPSGPHFATMEYWYKLDRFDCGSDVFRVKINGSIVRSYSLCNDPASGSWIRQLIDLSAYVGTSPNIMFELVNNGNHPSDVYLDDVSVYVCEGGSFSPLPVELINFEVKALGNDAELKWTTANELYNRGFEIEMQGENTDFQVVGFVPGNGSTSEFNSYDFTVPNLQPGVYYFRLRQLDENGGFQLSPIRSVSFKGEILVEVQPNPASEIAFFKMSLEKEMQVQLQLLDGFGRVVGVVADDRFSEGTFELAHNLDYLPAGVYYFRLIGDKLEGSGKFVVKK